MKNYLALLLFLLTACSSGLIAPNQNGQVPNGSPGPSTESPTPQPSPSSTPSSQTFPSIDTTTLNQIVNGSSCSKYTWGNRGKMPIGYMKGVAQVFARSKCVGRAVVTQGLGKDYNDALAHYGKPATLVDLYTIVIGLGPRESSGKYYEGRDMSADNASSDTAEAGLFQTSWNSHKAHPELVRLFNEYRAHPENCLLAVFQEGLGAHSTTSVGSGDGFVFQELEKKCPAFATEYAAAGLRVLRGHWGPINTKTAEFRPECRAMFESIDESISCK